MSLATRTSRKLPASVIGHDIQHAHNLDEALRVARLDWTVRDVPAESLTIMDDSGVTTTSIPGHRLLMRSDNALTLGVVSNRYTTVDNASAFALADPAHAMGAQFESAGETDHGRKVFLSMSIPEARVQVGGHDVVDFGILFKSSHDGSGAITGEVTGTRLVCTNGMTTKSHACRWSIRHTSSAENRISAAQDAMQHAFIYAKEFAARAEAMISTKITTREFEAMLNILDPRPEDDEATPRRVNAWERRRSDFITLFTHFDTQEEGRGTAWAAWNAVVEWNQWMRNSNGGEEGRALRNLSNPDSNGMADRALELLNA